LRDHSAFPTTGGGHALMSPLATPLMQQSSGGGRRKHDPSRLFRYH